MTTKIYCHEETRGIHNFFVLVNGVNYYLFTQKYKQSVEEFFHKPISIEDAMDFSKSRRDFAIINTMEKMPKHIRYFEQCSGLTILKKTKKSRQHRNIKLSA